MVAFVQVFSGYVLLNLFSVGNVKEIGSWKNNIINVTSVVTWPGPTTSKPAGIASQLKVGIMAASADNVYAKLALAAFAYINTNASDILPGYTLVYFPSLAVKQSTFSAFSRYPLFMSPIATKACLVQHWPI